MTKIAGVDVLLFINNLEGRKTILGGQTGATLNRSTSIVETSSKDGIWQRNLAGVNSWSLECDGFILANDEALLSIEEAWLAGENLLAELNLPTGHRYAGDVIISDFPYDFPTDGGATFSITLVGTGALTRSLPHHET